MRNEVQTRQHFMVLLIDIVLIVFAVIIFGEAQGLHGRDMAIVRQFGYGVTMFLVLTGFFDVIRWHGFLLRLDSTCVEIRHFWFFKKRYCRGEHNFTMQIKQNHWEKQVNKGTLDVYIHNGEVSSLADIANFQQVKTFVDALGAYGSF